MKKLIQINSVVNTGSTGRIVEEIGQAALTSGWRSYIAFGRDERSSESELIKIGNDWDIKMHGLQTRLFDRHGLASKKATKHLVKQIKEIKPDVIHLHNIHGYYINYKILFQYLSKTDIPVVWSLYDCWTITGHCAHFTYVGCDKWKTECYSCPQIGKYPASWCLDRSKDNFRLKESLFTSLRNLTLVPCSSWLSDIISESYLRKYPLKIIHTGIDTKVFKPSSGQAFRIKHKLQNKFLILGVAYKWTPSKGINDFFELSKQLNFEFQIVLGSLTRKQVNQLPDNIKGIERTESIEELADLYASCDVFLNPTYDDTFPTTNLEALSCGTPVITYKTGGSPESIDDSTGIVVEKGDMDGLIKAINQIKNNGKQYYTDACVKRAHRLYRKEDRFKEYVELYEGVTT